MVSRRTVLSTAGTALCASVAGCSSLTGGYSDSGKASIRLYNVHDREATLSIRVERADSEDSADPLLDATVTLDAGGTREFEHVMFFHDTYDITAQDDGSARNHVAWKANSKGMHVLYFDSNGTPAIRFAQYAEDQS